MPVLHFPPGEEGSCFYNKLRTQGAPDHRADFCLSFVRAGQQGVKHDEEGSGYGWKMEALIPAKDVVPPLNCQMERPPK